MILGKIPHLHWDSPFSSIIKWGCPRTYLIQLLQRVNERTLHVKTLVQCWLRVSTQCCWWWFNSVNFTWSSSRWTWIAWTTLPSPKSSLCIPVSSRIGEMIRYHLLNTYFFLDYVPLPINTLFLMFLSFLQCRFAGYQLSWRSPEESLGVLSILRSGLEIILPHKSFPYFSHSGTTLSCVSTTGICIYFSIYLKLIFKV